MFSTMSRCCFRVACFFFLLSSSQTTTTAFTTTPPPAFSRYYSTPLLVVSDTQSQHEPGSRYNPESNPTTLIEPEWADELKEMSARALVPVFYPRCSNNNTTEDGVFRLREETTSTNNNTTEDGFFRLREETISPEKALKRELRRFQKEIVVAPSNNNNESHLYANTAAKRHASRKILSDLILGTSVARIRHFYTLLVDADNAGTKATTTTTTRHDENSTTITLGMLLRQPISGALVPQSYSNYCDDRETQSPLLLTPEERLLVARAMVDLCFSELFSIGQREKKDDALATDHRRLTPTERLSIRCGLPECLTELLVEQYGEKRAISIAGVFNRPGPITVRANRIRCDGDRALRDRLWNEHGITTRRPDPIRLYRRNKKASDASSSTSETAPPGIQLVIDDKWSPAVASIFSLPAWRDGWFEVQDAGSQLIVQALDAKPGQVIVDYCAGNGGKTLALASELYRRHCHQKSAAAASRVVAHDVAGERLLQLEGSLDRAGLRGPNNNTMVMVETTLGGASLEDCMADAVLVDAPCSSLGVLRRRPCQRFLLSHERICEELPSLQLSILQNASRLVKRNGGGLVYATCSINRHENENVAQRFRAANPGFEPWPFPSSENRDPKDNDCGNNHHCQTILPTEHGSDGFFVARWKLRSI